MTKTKPRITVIGGGTGSFTLLNQLKYRFNTISAVVNMSDDGGSTGLLRDELGVLPPGDVRQCLVALSSINEARELFSYRFGRGMLKGHSLGNVIISGLELEYGNNFQKAIEVASKILDVQGQVLPVTLKKHVLCLSDGKTIIKGETVIAKANISNKNIKIFHEPKVKINPKAGEAIKTADIIIVAPGNLYGSLLPALSVPGIKQAMVESNAKVIMVANLVNKHLQTDGWDVVDYAQEIEKYIGKNRIDYVIYNTQKPNELLLKKYQVKLENPVLVKPDRFNEIHATPIAAKLLSKTIIKQDKNDDLINRSYIRHNAKALTRQILNLV